MNKDFIKKQNFIKELNVIQHITLWLTVFLSLSLFIIQLCIVKNAYKHWTTWCTCLATIGSVFSVMAGVKKRALCPLLGVITSIVLLAIAWDSQLYGSMIMYGVNIVVQAVSLITWIKGSDNKGMIKPKKLTWWVVILYILVFVGLTALFTWMEGQKWFYSFWSKQGDKLPLAVRIFDAGTLMFTVATFLPMIKKYDWVWYVYIIEDICICLTWLLKICLIQSSTQEVLQGITMIVSALSMTATCILGIFNWKSNKKSR